MENITEESAFLKAELCRKEQQNEELRQQIQQLTCKMEQMQAQLNMLTQNGVPESWEELEASEMSESSETSSTSTETTISSGSKRRRKRSSKNPKKRVRGREGSEEEEEEETQQPIQSSPQIQEPGPSRQGPQNHPDPSVAASEQGENNPGETTKKAGAEKSAPKRQTKMVNTDYKPRAPVAPPINEKPPPIDLVEKEAYTG